MAKERSQVVADLLGHQLRLATAHGLFSADRVDDGTRLLLDHLPPAPPKSVLDLGCGYGALGLPIAKAQPQARFLLVDRDILAAEYSRRNAASLGLQNVEARPSLGYRDVGEERFDWVLCNVPARIGDEAIRYILGAGAARLNQGGELRVVVIRDLNPVVESIAAREGWAVQRVADGARHSIFALGPMALATADHESFYLRDEVTIADDLVLQRPHDISEDPAHQRDGLPLLLDMLPKQPPPKVLVWRGGYGAVPLVLARRGATVTAADKDLLATTFVRRNAQRLGLEVRTLDVLSPAAIDPKERFALIVGELSTKDGDEAARDEVLAASAHLKPNGMGLWLSLTKNVKTGIEPAAKKLKAYGPLGTRGSYSVVRIGVPK